jgi:uncharacterized protein (TIRG00374 family)
MSSRDEVGRAPSAQRAELPRFHFGRRELLMLALFAAITLAALYYVLPRLAGLETTWNRINDGDPWWLAAAVVLELLSFASYVVLFRAVFASPRSRIGLRESYQIALAGLAATRVFAAAGAGGGLLTIWALRRSGMPTRQVAERMAVFLVLLYGVYMLGLLLAGLGLHLGLFAGDGSSAATLVPAGFGAVVIAVALATALVPPRKESQTRRALTGDGRVSRWARRVAAAPSTVAAGVRGAITLLRNGNPGLIGAVGWWGFDIAVLWACFHAFGDPPPAAVIVMAYFLGLLANLLPVPGGIGSVEGGMIGALIAFNVAGGLAIVAVLTYRAFAFWLPTVPGAIAYLRLRRSIHSWEAGGALAGSPREYSVPLPPCEAAEGDQADEGDDQADPETPDDHQDDPDDHDDPAR